MGTRQTWTWVVRGLLIAVVGAVGWQAMVAAKWRKATATEEARHVRIEQSKVAGEDRSEVNAQLQADLVAGRVTLKTAADRFLVLYAELKGATVALEQRCPGKSKSEQAAVHLLWRTANDPDVDPAVLDRLKREFVEEYLLAASDRVTQSPPVPMDDRPSASDPVETVTMPDVPMAADPMAAGRATTDARTFVSNATTTIQ